MIWNGTDPLEPDHDLMPTEGATEMTMKLNFTKLKITRVIKVTENAVLVQLTNQHDDMEVWVPRSNLSYRADKAVDKNPREISELEIADWWLKDKGL